MHERTVVGIAPALGTIQAAAAGEAQVPLRAMAEFVLAVGAGITLERLANGAALPDEAAIDLLTGALACAMNDLPDWPAATASASAEVP